jgi:hypothetical protein
MHARSGQTCPSHGGASLDDAGPHLLLALYQPSTSLDCGFDGSLSTINHLRLLGQITTLLVHQNHFDCPTTTIILF